MSDRDMNCACGVSINFKCISSCEYKKAVSDSLIEIVFSFKLKKNTSEIEQIIFVIEISHLETTDENKLIIQVYDFFYNITNMQI